VLEPFLLIAQILAGSLRPDPGETRMGPPPPGYIRITGEPMPGWTSEVESATAVSAQNWQPLGPRPIVEEYWSGTDDASGRVVAIAPHPTDPDTVYVGAASGGVWKTTDGGASWTALTDELSILNHGCVALDPSDPETVYVGTGEYPTQSTGDGLFRSTDGGATWEQLATASEVGSTCSRILVDPDDPQTIHVTGGISSGVAGYFRSTDGGATWQELSPDTRPGSGLVMHPTDSQILYLAQHGSGGVGGVYKSTNGGTNWTELTNGLPSSGFQRIVLALAPSSPSTVYAAYTNGGSMIGLYKTTNAGTSWSLLGNTPDFSSPQAWYDTFVAVDPTNANVVYAGGVFPTYAEAGVIKTTDGGNSWEDITCPQAGCPEAPNPHPDMHVLSFGADGTLWLGNDGGVWKSPDDGSSWIDTNATLTVTQNYAIALHPSDPAQAMGGTQDNGTVARDFGTEDWPQIVSGDGGFLAYDFVEPARRYTTYVYLTVFRLGPGPGEFEDITGPWGADPVNFIAPLVMDPNDSDTLLGGTNRVWRTQNASGAATWTAISPTGSGNLNAIAVAPGASDTIYTGSTSGQVRVTTNAGNWTIISSGLPSGQVSDLVVSPYDPATAYVAFYNTTGARVLRTTTMGPPWVDVTGTLPSGASARALALDWRFAPPTLYVGTGAGVYWSQDDGATWEKDGADLPNVNIGDLVLDPATNQLFAATYGRGAWAGELPDVLFGDGFESGDTSFWDQTVQ
jgi:photosystem II stability/assembly factor-like uncharacterized protein